MSVNDQQLRAIAFLAASCRPAGCKPWDESGIYSNLVKIRDRSLGAVIIAAVQAAEDRNAATPGVIPTPGPHWRDPASAPMPRQTEPASMHCGTCGRDESTCRARYATDHDYTPVGAARGMRRPAEAAHEIASTLKELIRPLGDRPGAADNVEEKAS